MSFRPGKKRAAKKKAVALPVVEDSSEDYAGIEGGPVLDEVIDESNLFDIGDSVDGGLGGEGMF